MDRHKKPDAVTEPQIIYKFIANLPFIEAVKKIEGRHHARLRFKLFDEGEDIRIYTILASLRFSTPSYGYQLRLKSRAYGEQCSVEIHKVDYYGFRFTRFQRLQLLIVALISILLTAYVWNWTFQPKYVPLTLVLPFVLYAAFNDERRNLAHSSSLEALILDFIKKELGDTPDDNLIDEEEINGGSYEKQA